MFKAPLPLTKYAKEWPNKLQGADEVPTWDKSRTAVNDEGDNEGEGEIDNQG